MSKVPGRQHLTTKLSLLMLLCRNQSMELLHKSTHWFLFLYNNNTGLEWVNPFYYILTKLRGHLLGNELPYSRLTIKIKIIKCFEVTIVRALWEYLHNLQ